MYQPKTISMKELSDSGDYFVYGANGIIGRYTNYNHENSEVVIACRGATCGAVNVTLPKSWINGNAMVVKPRNDLVCHDYLVAFLKVFNWKKVISGSAQPQITRKNLATVLFPLPPLEEQHRIVAKLNQLCDQIESAENAYKELSGSLSERFKQLCLEKAVQGKLVPQLESEPDGIQLGDVPNRCPFNIPTKWRWVYFSNVVECLDRKRVPVKKADRDRMKKIFDYYGATGVIDRVENYIFEERLLLIGEDGANLLSKARDNAFFATGKYWVNNHAHVFRGTKNCLLDYLAIYINAISLAPYVTGSAQPKLTLKNLSSIPVPLPPIEEQQRIVHQVSRLLLIINDLSVINK